MLEKKRRLGVLLAAVLTPSVIFGVFAGVVFWGGFNTVMEATNTMTFCTSCHEMRDYVMKEYMASGHYRNASGVQATCSDCHVPKDWTHKVIRKVQATKELYAKVIGRIDTPEKFAERRLDLARSEWRRMRESDSRECRNCHSFEAMDFSKQSPVAAKTMQHAATSGATCIDCHKGVAHKTPDVTARFRKQHKEIAARTGSGADRVGYVAHTIAAASLFAGPSSDSAKPVATLAPLTTLSVKERREDWLSVLLQGWIREGSEERIYQALGQRIPAASLSDAAAQGLTLVEKQIEPKSEETWTRVRLQGWIRRQEATGDLADLLAYGAEMYDAACFACHKLYEPQTFTANEWIGKSNAMKRFAPLTNDEFSFLQKYLQTLAKDSRR